MLDHDLLPAINTAPLPAIYTRAVDALTECSRIDECQSWADKAQAMASYARQSKDDTLRKMADRIQARAIRRCGELLSQVERAKNQHDAEARAQEGDLPRTRTEVATEAGLSEHQRKTALRVAAVPAEQFEQMVESDAPPTVTALAKIGTVEKKPLVDLGGIDPAHFARASSAIGQLREFSVFCGKNDPALIAGACLAHEIAALRGYVSTIDGWLDRFVVNL